MQNDQQMKKVFRETRFFNVDLPVYVRRTFYGIRTISFLIKLIKKPRFNISTFYFVNRSYDFIMTTVYL